MIGKSETEMSTMYFLWRLIRYRLVQFVAATASIMSFIMGRLIFGLILQGFFNALPLQKQLSPVLWMWIGLLALAGLVRGVLVIANVQISAGIGFMMGALLQRNLLARVLQRPGARAVPGSPGDAISQFRDDTGNVVSITGTISRMIVLTTFTIIAMSILLRINAQITLLVFLPLAGVVAIAQSMKKNLTKYRKASRQATSNLTSAIGEIFGAVQAIQVAGAEPEVVEHFATLNEERRRLMLKDTVFSTALNSVFSNTVGIGTGAILVLAALSIRSGQMGIGDLALFISYLNTVADFIQVFGTLLAQYVQTAVSQERLVKLMQGAPTTALVEPHPLYVRGAEPATLPFIPRSAEDRLERIEARDLSYCYPDTGRGIERISLALPAGSLTVVTGRIGSGKTTLIQVLLGLLPKDGGEIFWNGERVADPAAFFVPPRSAYTAQVPHLFSDPLKENILLGLPEERVDLQRAIHMAVMERDVAVLEKGLDTLIGTRGVKLSGGQAQRAAAARMLVRDPELLVFDDLSSALDVRTEHILWERIFAHRGRQEESNGGDGQRGVTCLVVSHRKAVLQHADHVIVLKGGKVEAEGKLEMLLATCEEMQQLWHGAWAEREGGAAQR